MRRSSAAGAPAREYREEAIATVTVLHAIGIWNEIILPTIYLTTESYYPITRGLIVFEGQYGSDWPGLAAAVLMLMLPMLVLFMFLQRYIISGLTSGAVKDLVVDAGATLTSGLVGTSVSTSLPGLITSFGSSSPSRPCW